MRTPILLLALASILNAQSIQEEPKANRMAKEQSPYLRQHAQDPVDWYPWGEAAFDKARKEGKPIFLSIGYAACHWCHVMQRESFQDEEVARVLNEHVVAIKLDREERPDVDRVYLDACQALGRRGGWPLSAFLTPDREPFYVATYIERDAFLELCQNVRQAWNDTERRQALVDYGKSLTARLRDQAKGHPQTAPAAEGELPGDPLDPTDRAIIEIPDPSLLADAARTLLGLEDKAFGGFAPEPHAPKFPNPSSPLFLLRHAARRGGTDSAEASGVRRLLDALLRGGIRDHLAGGFHRYSTDREWKVPHFEKMLYDQALIAVVLLEGWQVFGDPAYRDAVRKTLDFCLADMRTTEGGFIAAFDADADHEEGLTYVWQLEELTRILNREERDVVIPWAGATEEGNWELGRNILWASRSLSDVAQDLGIPPEEASTRWESARGKLLLARAAHPQPRTDTKVLTEWNGLMVSALARAGAAFSDARYVQEAVRTMTMVKTTLRQKDGTYRRSFAGGTARHPAELADYGALLVACLDLHEATLDARWLVEARELASVIDQRFSLEGGGLVDSRAEDLIVETSSIFDGAKPSGISLTLVGLARLGVLTGDPQPLLRARRLAASIERPLLRAPYYSAHALIGLDLLHHPAARVSMHGPVDASLLQPLRRTYMPFAFITREAGSEGEPQSSVVVCVGTRCLEPATAPDAVLERVRQVLDGQ